MDTDKLVSLVGEAGRAYSTGDLQEALRLYEQAVLLDPSNHVLYANRAAILCRLARFDESLQQAEHSIRLNPNWAKAYLRKGDALKGCAKLEKAMLAYCKGLTVDRDNSQLLTALIQCANATSIRDKVSSVGSVDAFVVVSAIGDEMLMAGQVSHAIAVLNAALDIDSDCLPLKLSVVGALSRAHYEAGNYRKAIDYLDIQLEIAQQLGDVDAQLVIHENIAKIAFLTDELALAVIHVRREIELKAKRGEDTDALNETLGGLFIQMGEYDAADTAFGKVKAVTISCLLNRAKIAIAKKEVQDALGYCEQMERVGGDADERAVVTLTRCKCLLLLAEPHSALRILRSATARFATREPSPHTIGLLFGILSECHLAVGQYRSARKWARKQLKIAISTSSCALEADALRNMANICEAIDDDENALVLCTKYDQLVQEDSLEVRLSSLRRIAVLCERCGEEDEAEKVLQQRLLLTQKVASESLIVEAHSDLVRFYRRRNNQKERRRHFDEMRRIFDESGVPLRESLVLEDSADFAFDRGDFEEAIDLYDKCLMLVQEEGNLLQEAQVCSKLAASHWGLFRGNEAIAYYEHSLAVYQQLSDLKAMMTIYSHTANIHLSTNSLQECHLNLRYYLTLAGFVGDNSAKLDALLRIGRVLLKEGLFTQSKKVLSKALDLANSTQRRREIGLIYGYLAECYIGFDNKRKAILNFCKQLPYFDSIDDTEGKCETLRHLIEEKRMNGDVDWTLKLCHKRVLISAEGSIDLQVTVLEEASQTALGVRREEDAVRFSERALSLCVGSRHPRSVPVLMALCSLYRRLAMNNRAILVMHQFVSTTEDSSEQLLYQLAVCHLRNGDPSTALRYFDEASKAVDDRGMRSRCEYAISCCHFSLNNYEQSLDYLRKSLQSATDVNEGPRGEPTEWRLRLEEALVEWFCGESVQSLETIQEIANKCSATEVAMALDETCLYEVLECDGLVGVSLLHSQMMRGAWGCARATVNSVGDHDRRGVACALDEAIILCNERKLQECVTFIERYLTECGNDSEREADEVRLLGMHNDERTLIRLLNAVLIICIYSLGDNGVIESLTVAERFLCNEISTINPSIKPSTDIDNDSTRDCLNSLQHPLLYRFRIDRFSLLWYTDNGSLLPVISNLLANGTVRMSYQREECSRSRLSLFNAHFLERILEQSSIERCDELRSKCTPHVVVNAELWGSMHEQRVALHDYHSPSSSHQMLVGLLMAGCDDVPSEVDHVSCINEQDLILKLQVCSMAVIDCTRMRLDVASVLQSRVSAHIVVLLNEDDHSLPEAMLLAGASCVVQINVASCAEIISFLSKVVEGEAVGRCATELSESKTRIYGDRSVRGQHDELSLWRKAVVAGYDAETHHVDVSGQEHAPLEESLKQLNDLPPTRLERMIALMRTNSTRDINSYMEELENELERGTVHSSMRISTLQGADPMPTSPQSVDSMTNEQIAQLIQLCKRVFKDHLYGTNGVDAAELEDDHLAELMKSFAAKERQGRRRRRRRAARAREYWSEGSCRSSFSEGNTDSEAVVIDIDLE